MPLIIIKPFNLTNNMCIFTLIFQTSELLTIYTIVITRFLSYFRPRFSVLSLYFYDEAILRTIHALIYQAMTKIYFP